MLDWSNVSGEEFELVCFELIRSWPGFENVDWFRGPGDRGRDIQASHLLKSVPGRVSMESWIFECKLRTTSSINRGIIRDAVDWCESHEPDCFMVLTNSHLTTDLKDWIHETSKKRKTKIQFLEGAELEEQLMRLQAENFKRLFQHQLGFARDAEEAALGALSDIVTTVSKLSRDERIPALITESQKLDQYRDENGNLPQSAQSVSVQERHIIEYDEHCNSKTTYEISVFNFSGSPLRTDRFRLYADVPVHANEELNLSSTGLQSSSDPFFFFFDTGYEKLVDMRLENPIFPNRVGEYSFQFDWPTPTPLARSRHYEALGRRPKCEVEVEIVLPNDFCFLSPTAMLHSNGLARRVEEEMSLVEDDSLLKFKHLGLRFGETIQIVSAVVSK